MKPTHPFWSFLRRRYALPEAGVPLVEAILRAEAEGGTACRWEGKLPEEPTPWIGPAGDESPHPLVWSKTADGTFLQSARWWKIERELARAWQARAAASAESIFDPVHARELLGDLPPDAPPRRALECALSRSLTLITGGPGTGKTYILARILACFLRAGALRPEDIALAAPTGKAAERMRDSIAQAVAGLPAGWEETAQDLIRVGEAARTLHALIGVHADTGTPRFDQTRHGPWRLLVIDEASMVEAALWQATLRALAPEARLVVLGDPCQLESVGPGQVLADLVRVVESGDPAWQGVHVELTEARRFAGLPGIVGLAGALRQADAAQAEAWLQAARKRDAADTARGLRWIEWEENRPFPLNQLPEDVWESLLAVGNATEPLPALEAFGRIGLLTPQREFAAGARAVSAAVAAELRKRGADRTQPIAILQNDAHTGLRNGSVGVLQRKTPTEPWRAFFPNGADGLRDFSPGELPDFTPAWCSTVHRAQGSEFSRVVVFVPRRESPLATRELLYTAITRAREEVILIGGVEAVKAAAAAGSGRITLLAAALRGDWPPVATG